MFVKDAVAAPSLEATVEKAADHAAIAARGVMASPAPVVDGAVVLSGPRGLATVEPMASFKHLLE